MAYLDWQAVERSSEFQQLVSRQRRSAVPATAYFLAWYVGLIALFAWAPGLRLGYVAALAQFLVTWGIGMLYLRRAGAVLDVRSEPARR